MFSFKGIAPKMFRKKLDFRVSIVTKVNRRPGLMDDCEVSRGSGVRPTKVDRAGVLAEPANWKPEGIVTHVQQLIFIRSHT